jgi:hypothetical protein
MYLRDVLHFEVTAISGRKEEEWKIVTTVFKKKILW